MNSVKEWKKVLESDLEYVIGELIEVVTTPSLIILTGPVGSGKTTFTKAFKEYISKDETDSDEVTSPTYSMIYESGSLLHADLYRIEDKGELLHLELPLYIDEKDYFLVEWGKEHLSFLKNEVGGSFEFYEMIIEINLDEKRKKSSIIQTRNYSIFKLDT